MRLSNSGQLREKLRQVLNDELPSASGPFGSAIKKGALKVLNFGIGQSVPFASRNGFRVVDMNKGYIKALIPFKGNKNHFGGMYAGAIFTVAEIPGGVIAMLNFDRKFFPILKSLKVDFRKVAKSDVTVTFEMSESRMRTIENEAEAKGKSEFTLEGSVQNLEGEEVARTYGVYQLRLKS